MNVSEWMQWFLAGSSPERLGRAVGLEAADVERVLREGLPLQVAALAEQARTPEGQAQIAQAQTNIPAFSSVEAALSEPDGAGQLEQAGQLLAPALLGDSAARMASQIGTNLNLDAARVERLLHLTLPLLLSFLGQRGVTAENIGTVVAGVQGRGEVGADSSLTPAGLIEFLKEQVHPAVAEQVGRAAGYTGSAAPRAAQAALPVLLNGLANRAARPEGAAELLSRRDSSRLTDERGHLQAALLADPAEVARIEGQGRQLLPSLFADVNAVTGRFGSALGGSGTNAGRLLALLAPLVTAVVLGRARAAGLDAAGLSRLLGGLHGHLETLLPPGLGSLGTLLKPATVETVAAAVPKVSVTAPPPPPASPVTTVHTVTTSARRRGFPWWLLPLLLLLGLGGCWLLRQPTFPAAGTATEATRSITVTSPSSGTTLPADDFVMSGTGPAGDTLSIADEGQQVASVTVGTDGTWEAAIPAPTPGEHTYTISGQESGTRSEFKVNVTGEGSGAGATTGDTGADDTGSAAAGAAAGAFAISEPTSGAQLPAGGFTLRGTGTPGQTVQVLEDGTSLGNVTVAEDGTWSLNVPSPAAGTHTYAVQDENGTELASVTATIAAADANASAAACTEEYTLSITDGQTVSEPFRFGGVGQGRGYTVTVKRGDRVIGTRDIPLDTTCGWSYQSRPGPGTVTYEVRPLGEAAATPLSTVTLTVTE